MPRLGRQWHRFLATDAALSGEMSAARYSVAEKSIVGP
jgi:hypothetical protein